MKWRLAMWRSTKIYSCKISHLVESSSKPVTTMVSIDMKVFDYHLIFAYIWSQYGKELVLFSMVSPNLNSKKRVLCRKGCGCLKRAIMRMGDDNLTCSNPISKTLMTLQHDSYKCFMESGSLKFIKINNKKLCYIIEGCINKVVGYNIFLYSRRTWRN